MEYAKKRRTRNNTVGFRTEQERFHYLIGLIIDGNETCLNEININDSVKERVLALALGNENQGYKLPAQSSPLPLSSGRMPSSRK
ncbi:hypothetical protein EDC32_10843 [Laceyella sacchari]|jgi:hypothetical protein|nr:hypothetical protein EDC32_10843 [Laceyella sacchari]